MKIDLYEYQDLNYKKFNDKLIITSYPTIGIRIPILRKVAKKLDYEEYLNNFYPKYYEDIILYIFCLSKIKYEFKLKEYVIKILPYIDCWSTCDTLCTNLSFIKSDLDSFLPWINNFLTDDNEFYVRFALVMLLKYYKEKKYLSLIINSIKNIHINEYYSNMALAWLLCELYILYPTDIIKIVNNQDQIIQKMFWRKVKDSYRTFTSKKR